MEQLHLLYLSDRDMQKIAAIMKTVPDIHSPGEAVSWALDHISVPGKSASRGITWKPLAGSEPEDTRFPVVLPPGKHKVAIYKIDVSTLGQLDTHAIIGANALKKIGVVPTHRALVSKISDLSK